MALANTWRARLAAADSRMERLSDVPAGTQPLRQNAEALLELARTSGLDLSPDMLAVVLELLRLDVTPQGVVALLRSLKDAKLKAAAARSVHVAAAS